MNKEVWKDVSGYEGIFMVSSLGRVKSLSRDVYKKNGMKMRIKEKILKQQETNDGYLRIRLVMDSKGKNFLVHRLVAESFLDKEEHHTDVNHIDENKKNNCVENLEWKTHKENCDHSSWYYKNMSNANKRNVFALDIDGKKTTFSSIKDMAEELNIKIPTAHTYVQKSRVRHGGKFEGWCFGYE